MCATLSLVSSCALHTFAALFRCVIVIYILTINQQQQQKNGFNVRSNSEQNFEHRELLPHFPRAYGLNYFFIASIFLTVNHIFWHFGEENKFE